MTETVSTSP